MKCTGIKMSVSSFCSDHGVLVQYGKKFDFFGVFPTWQLCGLKCTVSGYGSVLFPSDMTVG